jgi:hypothetical protein
MHISYRTKKNNLKRGFSIMEIILSAAIFCIFSASAITFMLTAIKAEQQGNQAEIAMQYASEGIEAVRAIRDDSFDRMADTDNTGLRFSDGKWKFEGEYDEFGIYRRSIKIISARRNGDGDIISDGGDEDLNMKRIVCTITWNSTFGREVSTDLVTYLANWK